MSLKTGKKRSTWWLTTGQRANLGAPIVILRQKGDLQHVEREDFFSYISEIGERKDIRKVLSHLHYTHFFMLDKYKKTLAAYDLSFPQINVLYIIGMFFPQ